MVRPMLVVPVAVRTPPRTAAEVEEVMTLVVGVAAVTVATVIAGPWLSTTDVDALPANPLFTTC